MCFLCWQSLLQSLCHTQLLPHAFTDHCRPLSFFVLPSFLSFPPSIPPLGIPARSLPPFPPTLFPLDFSPYPLSFLLSTFASVIPEFHYTSRQERVSNTTPRNTGGSKGVAAAASGENGYRRDLQREEQSCICREPAANTTHFTGLLLVFSACR